MLDQSKPTKKQLQLRALVERTANEAAAECAWCANCQRGITDSTAIPNKTAPMCIEHLALSTEWSRRLYRLDANNMPVETQSLVPEMTARGLEIARAKMVERLVA